MSDRSQTDSHLTSEGHLLTLFTAGFVAVALLAGIDIVTDLQEGTSPPHVVTEAILLALGLGGAAGSARLLLGLRRRVAAAEERADDLHVRLEKSRDEAAQWQAEAQELLQGLSAAIDVQFERWGLTPAEKEVGLLLLKGLSHKETAQVRGVTEATARQQSRSLYRKANLGGRNELSAFFLEDLILPPGGPA